MTNNVVELASQDIDGEGCSLHAPQLGVFLHSHQAVLPVTKLLNGTSFNDSNPNFKIEL